MYNKSQSKYASWKRYKKQVSTFNILLFQAANLRSLLLKRYFCANYSKIMEASEEKTYQTKDSSVRGETRVLKRAGVTLYEMQCQLNTSGATDLVIDIIMKKPSYLVFLECIKLAISLLEGGNHLIQVLFQPCCNIQISFIMYETYRCIRTKNFLRYCCSRMHAQNPLFFVNESPFFSS